MEQTEHDVFDTSPLFPTTTIVIFNMFSPTASGLPARRGSERRGSERRGSGTASGPGSRRVSIDPTRLVPMDKHVFCLDR